MSEQVTKSYTILGLDLNLLGQVLNKLKKLHNSVNRFEPVGTNMLKQVWRQEGLGKGKVFNQVLYRFEHVKRAKGRSGYQLHGCWFCSILIKKLNLFSYVKLLVVSSAVRPSSKRHISKVVKMRKFIWQVTVSRNTMSRTTSPVIKLKDKMDYKQCDHMDSLIFNI